MNAELMTDREQVKEIARRLRVGHAFALDAVKELLRIGTSGWYDEQFAHIESLEREVEALREALLEGMDAIISLVGAHAEITVWPEWDACSHFVHDHSSLAASPEAPNVDSEPRKP